ncbi:hypothetical protein D3C75_440530 [compost metagenome]
MNIKVHTMQKLISLGVILVLLIGISLYSGYSSGQAEISYRTDIKPISERFPNLAGIDKVFWSGSSIGGDFGPTNYWMRGYVFLSQAASTALKQDYTWENALIIPELQYDFKGKLQHWSSSEDFDAYIKSSSYAGNFYFDHKRNVLYFDVER